MTITSIWQDSGLCSAPGNDPAWWFPESGHHGIAASARAIEVCGLCPVRSACLAEAEATDEKWGIWGGRNFSYAANRRPPTPKEAA